MGIKYSLAVKSFAVITINGVYTESDTFVTFICNHARSAGWTREKIFAQVTFIATFGIVPGDYITLNGTEFEWYDTIPPVGRIPVPIGSDNQGSLNNLASIAGPQMGWNTSVFLSGIFYAIKFSNIGDTNDPNNNDVGNNLLCSIFPTGSVGVFDFPVTGVGQGVTWGGGYKITSNVLHSTPMILRVTTLNSGNFIEIHRDADSLAFDGLQSTGNWEIVADKYQFFLARRDSFGDGTFFFAGHLYPARGLNHVNYITGPTNHLFPNSGNRVGLGSISGVYYVDANTSGSSANAYYASNTGNLNQIPAICIPGFGFGLNFAAKVANNIGGLDFLRDDDTLIPYDSFVAACASDPSGPTPNFSILGWIWDSVVYNTYDTLDTLGEIDGNDAIVILSQAGTQQVTRGSLMVLIV